MRIADMIARCGQFVSLEFFPPKEPEKLPDFFKTASQLKALAPLFVSVTYGAGGSTRDATLDIVTRLKNEFSFEPMAHLTCVGASARSIREFIQALEAAGIDNVLALRGDPPKGDASFKPTNTKFRHAADLVRFIRASYPDFGLAVAGYPEKHPEADNLDSDCLHLTEKLEQGGDFVITQLFFDNRHYFAYLDRLRAMGVTCPVIPGILPILSLGSVKRIVGLCGASIPEQFLRALEEADARGPEHVKRLGIEHARYQIQELLARGVPGVHLYTLNKADACLEILAR